MSLYDCITAGNVISLYDCFTAGNVMSLYDCITAGNVMSLYDCITAGNIMSKQCTSFSLAALQCHVKGLYYNWQYNVSRYSTSCL
jgi:hypothetical protein